MQARNAAWPVSLSSRFCLTHVGCGWLPQRRAMQSGITWTQRGHRLGFPLIFHYSRYVGPRLAWQLTASPLQGCPKDQGFQGKPGGYCIPRLSYLCSLRGSCTTVWRQPRGLSQAGLGIIFFPHTYIFSLRAARTHTRTHTHDHTSIFPSSQHSYTAAFVTSLNSIYILWLCHCHWLMRPIVYCDLFFPPCDILFSLEFITFVFCLYFSNANH